MDGGHPRFSDEEIVRRGEEIYEQHLRDKLETDENIGKIVVIDIENGDFMVADDVVTADHRMLAKHPGDAIYAIRIGYDAIDGFRGIEPQRIKR